MPQKKPQLPVVLSIAGHDPSSGAGITADIKTIAAHGCYGLTCVTALTVQSTRGVKRVDPVEGQIITEVLEHLMDDLEIAAVKIASQLTTRATHAGAVNTLAMQKDGTILGDNTDGAGLVRDLCDNLGLVIIRRRILIIGAGGATRGVIAPLLALEPSEIVIANRTAERAKNMAATFTHLGTVQGVGFREVSGLPFDVVINGTSASLSGELPAVPAAVIGPETVCYDMAYGKTDTPFMQWALNQGCAHAIQGWGMLVEQAAESFRVWRGVKPSTASVLTALKERALNAS